MPNVVPEGIQKRRDAWNRLAVRASNRHYTIGILNLAFSAIAAGFSGLSGVYRSFAIAAAACAAIGSFLAGLLTFVDSQREAARRWVAWKILDGECLEFENGPTLSGKALADATRRLVEAARRGEKLLGDQLEHSLGDPAGTAGPQITP